MFGVVRFSGVLFCFCAIGLLTGCKPEKKMDPVPMTKAMTGVETPCESHVWGGFPRSSSVSQSSPITTFVCRSGYALNFNVVRGTSDWVVQRLTKDNLSKPNADMLKDEVRPDPDVPKSKQTTLSDYQGVGYVKGFLVSPRDFTFSDVDYSHAQYLSNVFPQYPGQDKALDAVNQWIRESALKKGELYVISGPIYAGGQGLGWVGQASNPRASGKSAKRGKIQVPTAIYKVVIDPSNQESIVFVVPNAPSAPSVSLSSFISSLDYVEKETGLLLAPDQMESEQAKIKRAPRPGVW